MLVIGPQPREVHHHQADEQLDVSAKTLSYQRSALFCAQDRSKRRLQRTSGDGEDGGHDEDGGDEDHPAHSDPANHQANRAQVEGPWLELLVVEEADGDGDGICMRRQGALSSVLPTIVSLTKQKSCHRQMHSCSHSCLQFVDYVMI